MVGAICIFFTSVVAFSPQQHATLSAVPHPPSEEAKIEALIRAVRELRDATFVRNGREMPCPSAAEYLRRRWKRGRDDIKTAREFIEELASRSPMNGEPYMIRFADGTERKSEEFLNDKLNELERSSPSP